MTNIINNTEYGNPASTSAVSYDSYQGRFYALINGQTMSINQETEYEEPLLDPGTLSKLLEMIDDWEREKYPERFL